MVYSGKPSTGCRTCRKRRIKCDEARPECRQCQKAFRECQGYPDVTDLLFQHQTLSTIKRVQRDNARKKRDSSTPGSYHDEDELDDLQSQAMSLYVGPQQPLEAIAINFYLQGTIIDSLAGGHSVGHLEYLPQLYLAANSGSALSHAVTTAALAALGKFDSGTDATGLAYKYYGTAISALSAALQDPISRSKNETLVATLMMIPVESLLAQGSAPVEKWAAHVRGAMWLLNARGKAVFKDPIASRMVLAVQRFLDDGTSTKEESVDDFLSQAPCLTMTSQPPDRQLSDLWRPIQIHRPRIVALLQKSLDSTTSLELTKAAETCVALDGLLLQWASNVPNNYRFDITSPAPTTGGLRIAQHVYNDCHVQRVWNSFRCARIFLNAMIYRCALRTGGANAAHVSGLLALLRKLATEICSSLPSQILVGTTLDRPRVSELVPQSLNPIQENVTSFFMLWPLFVARGVPSLLPAQREWIQMCFVELGTKYRIRGAEEFIEAGQDLRRPLLVDSYDESMAENVWEYSFLYGCGGI